MIACLNRQTFFLSTKLLIPTHAHFHWLKFVKNILKNSYMFRCTTIIRDLQCPCQSHYYLNTVVCMLSVVVWQHICNIII